MAERDAATPTPPPTPPTPPTAQAQQPTEQPPPPPRRDNIPQQQPPRRDNKAQNKAQAPRRQAPRRDGAREAPPRRAWTRLGADGADAFAVVSYNVLSQKLLEAHRELYAPWKDCDARRRSAATARELRGYRAALLCLQEVEPEFVDAATGAVARGARCFAPSAPPRTDGCLVVWDSRAFRCREASALVLDAGEAKVNAAAVAALEHRGGAVLVVASAHLLFNPNRADLRLKQAVQLLAEVDRLRRAHAAAGVVLCGDLNASPGSAVYALLARGRVAAAALEERATTGATTREQPHAQSGHKGSGTASQPVYDASDAGGVLESPLGPLASAYAEPLGSLPSAAGEPAFTTYIGRGTKGAVDYVFHAGLRAVGRFELLPRWLLRQSDGLPAGALASDHMALVARLALPDGPRRRRADGPNKKPRGVTR